MPFDPDAYLAKKATPAAVGAFNPDAYLKSKGVDETPVVKAPGSDESLEMGIAKKGAANIVDIGRGAIAGTISMPGELSKLAQSGANWANKKLGGSPTYWNEKTFLPEFDSTVARVPRLGTEQTQNGKGFETFGSVLSPVPGAELARGAMAVPRIGMDAARGVGRAVGGVTDALRGAKAAEAQGQALTATRGALSDVSKGYGEAQAAKMGEANTLTDVGVRLQRDLDAAAQRGGRPTLDKQGETVRTAFSGAMDAAKDTRAKAVAPLYDAAKKAAASREAAGARIDVAPATKDVEKLIGLADEIPTLKSKLNQLLGAVKGGPKPPGAPGIVDQFGKPLSAPQASGLTYEQLELANRYIKDIAYSADVEGYGAVIRNAAKELSKKLDTQITSFVPEHAAATDKYRMLSEPLESLGTRFGRAVTSTEGGLKSDAYTKIADQDLPAKLFAKKDGIELVVDALAGGKSASKEARLAAQTQVDTMVENWIMEGARGAQGNTGAKAAQALAAPQMQATMQAVPNVASRLGQKFGAEAQTAERIPQVGKASETARSEAQLSAAAKAKVEKSMAQAEVDYVHGSKKTAYQGYVNALRQNMVGDPDRYKAAIALIDRAATLQEKTDKARSLAMKIGIGGAAVGTGIEIRGLMQ